LTAAAPDDDTLKHSNALTSTGVGVGVVGVGVGVTVHW
jgi:hypothetical protein